MEWPKQLERIKYIYHTGIIKMVLDGINIKNCVGLVLNLTRNEGKFHFNEEISAFFNGFDWMENRFENFRFYLGLVHVNVDVNDRILALGMRNKNLLNFF